jgi:hypothetical protein
MTKLTVCVDFSPTPGSRYSHEGDFSGQEFRENVLKPAVAKAIESSTKLLIDLDGTAGYATSFLEESFGGLIRVEGFTFESLIKVLEFKSEEEPYLIDDVMSYIQDASEAS